MSKKPKIKPIHLVLTGLGIIILGILIPSLFVNAYSTMGFALIIGLVVLVSAYIFFSINMIKSRGTRTVKWLLIPVAVLGLGIGGWYAYHSYQQGLKDRIYSAGEVIELPDFTIQTEEPLFEDIDLAVPREKISRFGGLDTQENCSLLPDKHHSVSPWDASGNYRDTDPIENEMEKNEPTRRYCNWRNDSRNEISEYVNNTQRMTLNYSITASNNVNSSDIDISLMPDSGRTLSSDTLFKHDPLLSSNYIPAFDYDGYKPYKATSIGGDINKGITRQGSIEADIRNSEHVIDFKITYKGDSRIIRVNR